MDNKLIIITLAAALIFTAGCKKKDAQPLPKSDTAQVPANTTAPSDHWKVQEKNPVPQTEEMKIIVPQSVKGKWSAVKISIEDRTAKKTAEHVITLNSAFAVPGTALKIEVGEFLPDFRMDEKGFTSISNDLRNPAVAVRVFEGAKQIYPASGKKWGWLWGRQDLQNVHAFPHVRYNITLKEAVKNK